MISDHSSLSNVFDAILETHKGFGPGSSSGFQKAERMFDGAMPDNDVTLPFLANRTFDLHYEEQSRGRR